MKRSAVKKIGGLLLFLVGLLQNSFSDDLSGERVIYSFAENWLRYDKYYESYLPLKNKELKAAKSIHQRLYYERYRNYTLKFEATKGLALFVNNKLIYKKIEGKKEFVSIPFHELEPGETGHVLLSFFHPEGTLPVQSSFITYRSILPRNEETEEGTTFFLARNIRNVLSGYTLLFITIVTLFVVFKQVYPKEFIRYYSFAVQENSDHLLPGSFSIPSLWMATINGLVLSLLVYMLELDELIFTIPYSLFKGTMLILGAYFIFYIGKYLYLWLIAWLFNYSRIVSSQFAEYVRFFERVCLFSCVVIFGFVASGFITLSIKSEILYYSLIIVLVFCVIKVIFLFFRLITHRNLYLFSYLCAAEILPLIIAVKILLF